MITDNQSSFTLSVRMATLPNFTTRKVFRCYYNAGDKRANWQKPINILPKVFFERFEALAATIGTFSAITNKF